MALETRLKHCNVFPLDMKFRIHMHSAAETVVNLRDFK